MGTYNPYDVVDAYDDALTRSTAVSLSSKRSDVAAASVGQFGLFGGGGYYRTLGSSSGTVGETTVDAYNERLVRTTAASLSTGRSRTSAVSIGRYAIFAGGYCNDSLLSAAVDVIDESLTRIYVGELSVKSQYLSSATLNNHAVFGCGSLQPTLGGTLSANVDVYDEQLLHRVLTRGVATEEAAAASIGSYVLFGGGNKELADGSSDSSGATDTVDAFSI